MTALACGVALAAPACRRERAGARERRAAPASSAGVSAVPARARPAPLADERIEIAGGSFRSGSLPGDAARKPELEPRLHAVELGPYRIDRLPYPNDPARPALTGVARSRAAELCIERGERLCTELEWERACKGPASQPFATGSDWDRACGKTPSSCASGFDVLAMGTLREWTASDVVPSDEREPRRAAVRGAAADTPDGEHRCARRLGVDPETTSADLGFRCCKGPPNAAVVAEPALGPTFRKAKVTAARLAALLEADPRTRALARDLVLFREPEGASTVAERQGADRKGFLFTVAPLLWNPAPGADFLVATGRSGKDVSFVVAFYVLGDDDYRLASSFVMKDEPGPVALAYSGTIRPRLHFSTSWGSPGDTGKILYRSSDSVIILAP